MQLDFNNLQHFQASLLAANPYFENVAILIDNGAQEAAVEDALRRTGACILVCPVTIANRVAQATHQLSLSAENPVKLIINPKRNADPDGAGVQVLEAIRQIIRSILAYDRNPGESFWTTTDTPIELNTFDPGLWSYDLTFAKEFLIT